MKDCWELSNVMDIITMENVFIPIVDLVSL